VPIGGALSATKAAALVAQLDPKIVVPMTVCEDDADCEEALRKFLHEMGAEPAVQPRLSVTPSSLPPETTTVLLEPRGRT
jgi:L-ascorbate metabolism protein UlaG (beta-lactamase superfamily)